MRLQAIREYTAKRTCEHKPPLFGTSYVVTFMGEDGLVVADCHFGTKKEADFVVEAVNKSYDEQGESQHNKTEWEE